MSRPQAINDDRGSILFISKVCLIAALGGLLFGYDTGVISGAIEFLQARFQLTPEEKGWASSCVLLGCALGASMAGIVSDRFGRKKTLYLAAILFLVSSVGTAVPDTLLVFSVFRVLAGVGVGIASITSPMYIAEITPARIRGRMVSVNQLAIVGGILVVYFVNYFIARQGDPVWQQETAWRWMFASCAFPSAILLVLLALVPESPRWLVENGKGERALAILARALGRREGAAELASIEETLSRDTRSLRQILEPHLRFVLLIGIALAVLQQVTGINVFLYFGTTIFKQLGSSMDVALLKTIVVGTVNLLFTVIAIRTVDRLGRKPLMILGSVGMGISLLAIGLAAQFEAVAVESKDVPVWPLVFILGYIACFALSVGPVTWVILSEIFPTSIRGRAMGIATFCLWMADYAVTQTFPMIDENEWLLARFHHAFPFYIYGAFCVVLVAVMVFLVPETKGKSLEEIEGFWKRRAGSGRG